MKIMSSTTSVTSLVRDRAFMTLFAARTLAMLAFAFLPVALAFGVLDMPGGSAGLLSTVLTFQLTPTVVLMLVGGVVADRHSRARVIALGETCMGTGSLALGTMLLSGYTPVWLLCACAALTGVSGALVHPALTGIIPDLVAEERLTEANSYLQGANATARLIGVVAGGAAVAVLGGGLAIACAALMYYTSAALTLRLPKTSRTAGTSEPMLHQLRAGWSEFSSHRWLWVVVLAWGLMYLFFQASVGVVGPVIANEDLGGAMGWTTVLACQAAGAITGIVVSMRWRPIHPLRVGCALALFVGVPGLLLGLQFPLWSVLVFAFAMGVGFQMLSVYWLTSMQLEVPPQSLSRVASYDALGSLLLGPLGLVLAGPAVEAFGAHPTMIVCSVASIAIISGTLLSKEVRDLSPYGRAVPAAPR
jgi:MFS family permease